MFKDTWYCDSCGKQREDQDIEVITYPISDFPFGERNYKYCVDDNACHEKALIKSKEGTI